MSLDLESSRAVAGAGLQRFILKGCEFEDEGASLIESVRTGQGPQGLSLSDMKPFTTLERWISFMDALEDNNGSLKFLEIAFREGHHVDEILQGLADALLKNSGLAELSIRFESFAQCKNVWHAISAHPSFRKLNLSFFYNDVPRDEELKRERTKAVVDMPLKNKQVEGIEFYDHVYDRSTWDTGAAPRLESNIYRKRFPAIQKVDDTSTRAAILGAAMGRVRTKASLLYMLLCDNRDTIVTTYVHRQPATTMRLSCFDRCMLMWNLCLVRISASMSSPADGLFEAFYFLTLTVSFVYVTIALDKIVLAVSTFKLAYSAEKEELSVSDSLGRG
jgi:hypothetical protein